MDNTETNDDFARRMRTRRGEAPAPARKEPILGHYRVVKGPSFVSPQLVLLWLIDERGASIADTDDCVLTIDRFSEAARQGSPHLKNVYVVTLYDDEVPDSWLPNKLK